MFTKGTMILPIILSHRIPLFHNSIIKLVSDRLVSLRSIKERKESIRSLTSPQFTTSNTYNMKSCSHDGLHPFTMTVVDLTFSSLIVTYVQY